tara:strand:+ start:28 stop:876 length:849 start_codon:yes stop_codon:yes gene_type:complete
MLNKYKDFENIINEKGHYFCISHFNGKINWITKLNKENYIVYNKSGKILPKEINHFDIENVGYNIYSYLKYIIDNYDNLPESIVFCKDNIFTRHINFNLFKEYLKRNTFTCLEEKITKYKFPINLKLSEAGFTEINSSWYKYNYPRLFFKDYNTFYKYIFKEVENPHFLRFAPGANYIVPKNNILSRSKIFYKNLMTFISHSQFSCESHYLERSLYVIWNSSIKTAEKMNSIINNKELKKLKVSCNESIGKEKKFLNKLNQNIIFKLGNLYMNFLLKKSLEK